MKKFFIKIKEIREVGLMLKSVIMWKKMPGESHKCKRDKVKLKSLSQMIPSQNKRKKNPEPNMETENQKEWSDSKNTITSKKMWDKRKERRGKSTDDF